MLKSASQTKRLSGRAQRTPERKTVPMDLFFRSNRLTNFQRDQFANHEISERERENERGHRSRDGAERNVTENVEAFDLLTEEVEVIHHRENSSARDRFVNSSSTRSIRAERLPLIKTKSPGAAFLSRSSAASS